MDVGLVDHPIPRTLADLRRDRVVSLDMETAAIAAVCQRHGGASGRWCGPSATGPATEVLTREVFHLSNQDGTPNAKAVASYMVKHPGRIPAMARMAKAARLATVRAAHEAIAALSESHRASG